MAGPGLRVAGTAAPRRRFAGTRRIGWLRLGLGWVCAQSLLTLIPIASGPGGVAVLTIAGGGFVVMALTGAARLAAGRIEVGLDPAGLELAGHPVPWQAVAGWRGPERGRGLTVSLAEPLALPLRLRLAAIRRGPRLLRLEPGMLDASLTEVAAAFRQLAPHLEDRP